MKFFLPSAQSMKVFCYLCNFVYKQLEKYMVYGLTMHSAIKANSRVDCLGGGSVCKVKLSSFFSANCLSSWKGTSFEFFTFIFTKTSTQMSLYHISLRWLSLVALVEFNLSCLPWLSCLTSIVILFKYLIFFKYCFHFETPLSITLQSV